MDLRRMTLIGAAVGATIGMSAGASIKSGSFVDPMSALLVVNSALGEKGMGLVEWYPVLGALAGGYAGYYGMIPYVSSYV